MPMWLIDIIIGVVMNIGRFILISGSIFFIFMLLSSYFLMYPTIGEALKFTVIATLIFVPVNFLLNKAFNQKAFGKNKEK
ncbi:MULTISPECIES: hypothetical protein [Neisseria]|nr:MULTISPECIES: hypothetical protein [unclassified Neisseria]MBF0803771.1 hypothetical protein [Neisseria sp. 19428wB4_WF04]TFU43519.1 hypothetical protein E4T99_05300 [Neisseria sp. WF04]